jgi:hypothetical protein
MVLAVQHAGISLAFDAHWKKDIRALARGSAALLSSEQASSSNIKRFP